MIKDITIGQYFPLDSPIHNLDPKVKLISSFAYIILLFIVNSWLGYALMFLFLASVILMSKIKIKIILKGLKPVLVLILFTAILNLFFTNGSEVLVKFWGLTIYKESIISAIFMVLRLVFLIIGTSLLTYTTSPIILTDGIEDLMKPLNKIHVPVHDIAMLMTLTLRFIPTLVEETDKIMSAQKSRGASFDEGGLIKRGKALIPILIPLFVSAFRRAEDLAIAMECRCYNSSENRTRLKEYKFKRVDFVAISVMILLTAATILIKIFI